MTEQEFKEMYEKRILPYSRDPYHFSKPTVFDTEIEAYNPLCGDKYIIYIRKNADIIEKLHFQGFGCAVSRASISLMLQSLEQKSLSESLAFVRSFLKLVDTGKGVDITSTELQTLAELRNFNGRLDCVKLGWNAVYEALN